LLLVGTIRFWPTEPGVDKDLASAAVAEISPQGSHKKSKNLHFSLTG
jgi:hypothetical protein